MGHKLVLRFDIDTHKCIRNGVPNLLDLAEKYDVPFTFFLNTGRAVALFDSLFKKNVNEGIALADENSGVAESTGGMNNEGVTEQPAMMTARQKFGNADFLQAAILNPRLTHYKKQILRLWRSNCEMGIHGGRNHALWQKYGATWGYDKTRDEIEWALKQIRWIIPEYTPFGFLSPGWNSTSELDAVLYDLGFLYCADMRCADEKCTQKECAQMECTNNGCMLVDESRPIYYLGTNLLHEPGAVAFFEGCRVKGLDDDAILKIVTDSLESNEITVLYDHPYYSGVKELDMIEKIIVKAKEMGVEIITMKDMISK